MSPPGIDSAYFPGQSFAGDGRLRRRFSGTGHGPFRPLIVSNLKWGRTLSRPLPCFRQADVKSSTIFYKRRIEGISYFLYSCTEWPETRSAPHLTRETISGRRLTDGADTLGGVFRPSEPSPWGGGKIKNADAVEIHPAD